MKYSRLLFFVAFVSALSGESVATPIRSIPNLSGLRVYERTVSLRDFFFAPNDGGMNRIADLGIAADFLGASQERYDVYYSNEDGTPNFDGSWLTIDALFPTDQGGHNITDVQLEFTDTTTEFADRWSREVGFGSSYSVGSVVNAIDGDLNTHTTLGRSNGNDGRLSITIGFASSVPEPSAVILLAIGCIGSFIGRR